MIEKLLPNDALLLIDGIMPHLASAEPVVPRWGGRDGDVFSVSSAYVTCVGPGYERYPIVTRKSVAKQVTFRPIESLLHRLWEVVLIHDVRECNTIVNAMTKMVNGDAQDCRVFYSPPYSVLELPYKDCSN
ncbi:hypothetical protein V6N11_044460 [Hibiscus sabdariffa]|uniref:Uncharacterized protein n=1 Tax=Hibiscus sabdariffa TaxID=183260 RepID=A0ABR2RFL2_9ROSI